MSAIFSEKEEVVIASTIGGFVVGSTIGATKNYWLKRISEPSEDHETRIIEI